MFLQNTFRYLFLSLLTILPGVAQMAPMAISERYVTPSREADNVDSIAIFPGPSQCLAIVTAKATDLLLVHDAVSGELIKQVGGTGTGELQFRRPNGILVLEDLLFVVERDNHRVQVLKLPEFTFVANLGAEVLRKPYGLSAFRREDGHIRLYVTDDYELPKHKPAADFFTHRVKLFELRGDAKGIEVVSGRTFGEADGPGQLFKVESILADVANQRLFICDEQGPSAGVKIYNLEGKFTGATIDRIKFVGEPEGLALIATGEMSGYLISTDQQPKISLFYVLDRETLQPVGVFHGKATTNTDGIVVYPKGLPGLPSGGMWAIHDDQSLVSFDWDQVRQQLKLR